MPSHQKTLLCHYRYDPLDRLVHQIQQDAPTHQLFYCKNRLATEIQGVMKYSIAREGDHLFAQNQNQDEKTITTLLATDLQRSVLHAHKANNQRQPITYSPYGHRQAEDGFNSLLGFNGERPDHVTGCYLLGNGYRAFNPVLLRFNSPDSMSPFGKGGMNSYAYCLGDPINLQDSNGNFSLPHFLKKPYNLIKKWLGINTYKSGPENTFSRATTTSHPESITPTRTRKNSAPLPIDRGPSAEELSKWDLIGYHGSTRENAKSLMLGLDPTHMGKKHGLLFGRGFYVAPDPSLPARYAIGMAMHEFTVPQIFGAYTKNLSRLKLGRDLSFKVREKVPLTRPHLDIIIREPAYNLVVIRAANIRDSVVLPKSYEAPF
ncbi:RHS repeat-associated core domain-containing protein [Pseudomonas azerbaijanoccidentalis]